MTILVKIPVYPRACGGAERLGEAVGLHYGLSPRVRGSPVILVLFGVCHGSIPARAGEPANGGRRCGSNPVYPRACGGAPPAANGLPHHEGLSPRVRGSRSAGGRSCTERGSIPARAGEPPPCRSVGEANRVYPRACGGAIGEYVRCSVAEGLSPRVRGSPKNRARHIPYSRSIPARAGEPS